MKNLKIPRIFFALSLAVSAMPAMADSLNVYVGYADNLRPSGFFPTPWLGDSNVVSQSSANQSFDSGAVRIDNTGTSSITISNFEVTLNPSAGPILFNIWSSLTIAPGQVGIFTQTGSYNFDSSDNGVLGSGAVNITPQYPLGGCTNPSSPAQAALCAANAPVVSFMENGTQVTLNDSGQVLNTFGYDFINGSTDGNESINWNLIGSSVNRGGDTPEPSTLVLLSMGLAAVGFNRKRLFNR